MEEILQSKIKEERIYIERSTVVKGERKLESALDVINGKEIEDLNGCRYNFKLV